MKGKFFILFLAVLVLGFLLFPIQIYRLFYPATKQDVVQKVFKNRQVFDAFFTSQDVTAQLLQKGDDERAELWKLNSYRREAPVLVPSEKIRKLKELL